MGAFEAKLLGANEIIDSSLLISESSFYLLILAFVFLTLTCKRDALYLKASRWEIQRKGNN